MMDRTIPESHRADSSTPFPIDLYRMLEAASEQNLEHIVCWSQDGLGWFVRDRKAFASDVMPIFFYRLKMSSFKRLLYAHGFRTTILKGCKNGGAYYQHPLFVRDKPELANNIQKIVKGRPSKASQCRDLTSSADVQTIISFSEGNLSLSGEKENLSTSTKMGSKRTYTSFVNPTEQMFAYEKLTFTNTTLALPPPLNPTAATTRPQSPSLSQPVPQQQLQQLQDSHSFSALLSFLDQQADHCLATNQIDLEPRPLPPNFNASRCQNGQSTATAEQSFADDIFSGMSFYAI